MDTDEAADPNVAFIFLWMNRLVLSASSLQPGIPHIVYKARALVEHRPPPRHPVIRKWKYPEYCFSLYLSNDPAHSQTFIGSKFQIVVFA